MIYLDNEVYLRPFIGFNTRPDEFNDELNYYCLNAKYEPFYLEEKDIIL